MPRRLTALTALVALCLALTGCAPDTTGYLAVAMDPAGRLITVVAVCDGHRLGTLTFTDETTGTRTVVSPAHPPAFGGTLILTGPVTDPHPEGVLDLFDRGHEYRLTGGTNKADSTDSSGILAPVQFRLDALTGEPRLRQGYVLAATDRGGFGVVRRDDFVARSRKACG